MSDKIDFYFDFISPFGYFASLRIDEVAAAHGRTAVWSSMLIGVSVLKVMGLKPLLQTPLKGEYVKRDAERYCRRHGIVLKRGFGGSPPSNPLPAGRAFHWLDRHQPELAKPVARAIYDAYWRRGVDIGTPEAVADIAAEAGADRSQVLSGINGEGAELLRQAVDRSLERGVFGSPYFIVDDEPFFGVEKLELLEEWLRTGGW